MTVDNRAALQSKKMAGEAASSFVKPGMKVGLGTGSTIYFTIQALGQAFREGRLDGLETVATSERTATLASSLGLVVRDLSDLPTLDVTIDGADEVDPALHLVKGLGGALLREKIVASSSARMIVVVDSGKLVNRLGTRAPVPVEVDSFGWKATALKLAHLDACAPVMRLDPHGAPYRTDGGHYILDCHFAGGIDDAAALERAIDAIPGVVESGLFIGLASRVLVGDETRALEFVAGAGLQALQRE